MRALDRVAGGRAIAACGGSEGVEGGGGASVGFMTGTSEVGEAVELSEVVRMTVDEANGVSEVSLAKDDDGGLNAVAGDGEGNIGGTTVNGGSGAAADGRDVTGAVAGGDEVTIGGAGEEVAKGDTVVSVGAVGASVG